MNIKETVEKIVKDIMSDKELKAKWDANAAKVIEKYVGVDLPDEQVNQLVDAIEAKLKLDQLSGALGGLFGK